MLSSFVKSNFTNLEDEERTTVPTTTAPEFQNAQQVEEPSSPTSDTAGRTSTEDPFASQREPGVKWDMFTTERHDGAAPPEISPSMRERRMSKEWDASKVPPSRFQKREGSIHATPASRDGHIDRNKLKNFAEKYMKKERRKSDAQI